MPLEDKRLAARAANGEQEAFTTLVERHRAYVYAIAYKIALDEDDALDITQNVLLRLVRKIGTFNGRSSFRTWLATVTSNEAMSFLRKPSRREHATEAETLEAVYDARHANPAPSPRDSASLQQRRRLVDTAMKALPAQQRAILALRLKEDMRPKEIAEELGIPARQVRSQLHRAIAKVRETLKGTGAE